MTSDKPAVVGRKPTRKEARKAYEKAIDTAWKAYYKAYEKARASAYEAYQKAYEEADE